MTQRQASRFLDDVKRDLDSKDYIQTLYLSIKNIGTKIFRNATFQLLDGWLFIITPDESFCIREKDLGDFICIDMDNMPIYDLKNE